MKLNYFIEKLDYGYILTEQGEKHAKLKIEDILIQIQEKISSCIYQFKHTDLKEMAINIEFVENPEKNATF